MNSFLFKSKIIKIQITCLVICVLLLWFLLTFSHKNSKNSFKLHKLTKIICIVFCIKKMKKLIINNYSIKQLINFHSINIVCLTPDSVYRIIKTNLTPGSALQCKIITFLHIIINSAQLLLFLCRN